MTKFEKIVAGFEAIREFTLAIFVLMHRVRICQV